MSATDEESLSNLSTYKAYCLAWQSEDEEVLRMLSVHPAKTVRCAVSQNENTSADTLKTMFHATENHDFQYDILLQLKDTEEFSVYPWEWLVSMR